MTTTAVKPDGVVALRDVEGWRLVAVGIHAPAQTPVEVAHACGHYWQLTEWDSDCDADVTWLRWLDERRIGAVVVSVGGRTAVFREPWRVVR